MANIALITNNILSDSGTAITSVISGSGTTNYLSKFTGSTALGNSIIYDNGTAVGIGTTSPNSLPSGGGGIFSIYQSAAASLWLGGNVLSLDGQGTARDLELYFRWSNSATISTDSYFKFLINNSEKVRIASSGNVLIGTTTDGGQKLQVAGEIKMAGTTYHGIFGSNSASWAGGTNYPTLYSNTGDGWIMHINPHISYTQNGVNGFSGSMTGSTIRFASNASASNYWDLGVGTNSVGADTFSIGRGGVNYVKLNTNRNLLVGPSNDYTRISVSNGNSTRTGITLSDGNTASLMLFAGNSTLASISFDTYGLRFVGGSTAGTDNGSEYMRISNSGNLLIGSTTDNGQKLQVSGNVAVTGITATGNKRLSLGILDINSQGTPGQIRINTTIPFASGSADFTVNIKGFRYAGSQMVSLSIGWHYYLSSFYNKNAISSGSWTPTVTLACDAGGYVVIHLSSPDYWPKLYVESVYSSAYGDAYSSGWTWTDADLSNCTSVTSVTCKPLATDITGNSGSTSAVSGTTNYISKFTSSSAIGNSLVYDNGTNVGVGTVSPTSKLSVVGIGRVFNALSTNDQVVASFSCNSGGISTIGFNGIGTASDYHVRIGADVDALVAYTANVERLRIVNSGNVLINTTTDNGTKLNVNGSVSFEGGKIFTANNASGESLETYYLAGSGANYWRHIYGGTGTGFGVGAGGYGIYCNGNSDYSQVYKPSGDVYFPYNIGIGVTSPGYKLDVAGETRISTGTTGNIILIQGSSGRYVQFGTDGSGQYIEQVGTSGATRVLRIQNSNGSGTYTQLFLDGANQKIYTSSNVNVIIGTTTDNGNKLQVIGNVDSTGGGIKIGFNVNDAFSYYGTSTAHYGMSYGGSTNPVVLSGYFGLAFTTVGSQQLFISTGGSITAASLTGSGTRMVVADASGTLSTQAIPGGISGSGTTNYIPKFTGSTSVGNSNIVDNGGNIGIGTTSSISPLEITNTGSGGGGLSMFTSTYSSAKQWGFRQYGIDNGSGIYWASDVQFSSTWYNAIRIGHGQNANNPSFQSYYGTYLATNSGNVLIGTTTNNGYKLQVSGTTSIYTGATVTDSVALTVADGSNGLNYIPYVGTGSYNNLSYGGGSLLFNNISSRLTVGTHNGTAIQFGPTNTLISGNVGLGTLSPAYKLQISDNSISNASGNNSIIVHGSVSTGDAASLYLNQVWNGVNYPAGIAATYDTTYGGAAAGLSFYTSAYNGSGVTTTKAMYINPGGNIGIGTINPSTKLEVYGGHGDTKARLFSTGNGSGIDASLDMWASEPGLSYAGSGIGNNVNGSPYYGRRNTSLPQSYIRFIDGDVMLYTGSTTASSNLIAKASGNVLIGTTTDGGYKLSVNGSGNFNLGNSGYIRLQSGSGQRHGYIQSAFSNFLFSNNIYFDGSNWRYDQNGYGVQIQTETLSSGVIAFNTFASGTGGSIATIVESMRIVNNGNILMGTTTDSGYKLDVNGTSRFTNSISLTGSNRYIGTNASNLSIYITGGSSYLDGAYFNLTGNTYGASPGAGSAEFVIRTNSDSKFALFGYNGSSWSRYMTLYGPTGNLNIGSGTTDSGYKLRIEGNTYNDGEIISVGNITTNASAYVNANQSGYNLTVYPDITSGPNNLYSGGQVKANIYTSSNLNPVMVVPSTSQVVMAWYPSTTQGVFIDYTIWIYGGANAMRSGTFMVVNDSSGNVQYTDIATPDLNASTALATLAAANNGGVMEVTLSNGSGNVVFINTVTRYIPTMV